jgi:predicted alpha/beta hydrolase
MVPPPRISSEYLQLAHTGSAPAANPAAVTLVTEDGFPVCGTRWLADGDARGTVLIAPATGVPQWFYRHFAAFLAGSGFDVLTWDWRGIACSRHEADPRDPRLTMTAWAKQDLAAAIAWAERRRLTGGLVALVGHSFGGQALGLAPNAALVDAAVLIAAQDGYFRHWPWTQRWLLAALWHVAMPAAATLLGRFPASRLGLGEDLPAGVALEWARWCRHPEFLRSWDGHAAIDIPMLAVSFDDDRIAPPAATASLLRRYSRADIRHEHQAATGLGHFGFFREGRAAGLWARVARFLREAA